MVYSVITIANKFIDLAKNESLTNMQLQKMFDNCIPLYFL
jgi:uncharacterized phage-associated protein